MAGSVDSGGQRVGHRAAEFVLGPRFARRLVLTHAIDDFGDAMVNLSLVGSLFLFASVDASRDRILLYLVLTAAPLVVVAPVVGALLDRTALGYRVAVAGSQIVRAAVALVMIGSLLSVAVYPLAFTVLIARKVYALAKMSLLSQMTDDQHELLRSDAQLARTGTVAGGVGTALGGVLLALDRTALMLLIAAAAFLAAAFVSRKLPRPRPPVLTRSLPRWSEAIPRRIWEASLAAGAVCGAAGALTYLLAFAIKRGGGDEWIFATGLLIAGTGSLLANVLAGKIHRTLQLEAVLAVALLVPGFVCAIGVVTIGNLGVLAIAFSIGFGRGIATRAITGLNATVPLLARARTIARTELTFQIATLLGAVLAVQFAPSPNAGFAVSSVVLVGAGVAYVFRHRTLLRRHAARLLLGDEGGGAVDGVEAHRTLPEALLMEARRLASIGAYRMAVVVASAAVEVTRERAGAMVAESAGEDARAAWDGLAERVTAVRAVDDQPDEELVLAVLGAADSMVAPHGAGPAARAFYV